MGTMELSTRSESHLNRPQAQWGAGLPATNAWQAIGNSFVSELLGRAGYDVVTLDMQHGLIDRATVPDLVRAITAGGSAPFVRLPSADADLIGWLLDVGIEGLICPTVESAEHATRLVSAALYPPHGSRSYGPLRGASIAQGYEAAAAAVSIFAMIESAPGFAAVEAIASVSGLTGLFVGPGDLGIGMGLGPGQNRSEPAVVAAISVIQKVAKAHGLLIGIHASDPAFAAKMGREGFDLVTVTADTRNLVEGFANDLRTYNLPSVG
jgi:4-hydroxy-2-oxoheptanedioate aldolase